MRRLLAAVIASGAIAALAGGLSSSAGAAYRGTFLSYPEVQVLSGPEFVGPLAVMDSAGACTIWNNVAPENNPYFHPCGYRDASGICTTVINEYWQQLTGWVCTAAGSPVQQIESAYVGDYGWVVVATYLEWQRGAPIFMMDNWG